MTLCQTLTFASAVRFGDKFTTEVRFFSLIFYPILVAAFFLQIFADQPPRYVDIDGRWRCIRGKML